MAGLGHWYAEIEKQGFWRGNPHTWVNRYILSGADPTASDALGVLDALLAVEESMHPASAPAVGVGFVERRAYKSTGGPPFATRNDNLSLAPGTATGFSGATWAGSSQTWASTLEVCTLVETLLVGLNSRGKPNYLRKFYRGAMYGSVEDHTAAQIPTADLTGIAAACLPLKTGLGSLGAVVIGTGGALPATAPTAHKFLANHQIPRGKKKTSRAAASAFAGAQGFATGYIAGNSPGAPTVNVPKRPSPLEPDPDVPFLP